MIKNSLFSTRFTCPTTRSLVLAGLPLGKKRERADHAKPAARVSENEFLI
ncbi:MAG: hypothetical protein AAB738_02945 [Patescibacteria group bacterium]